MKKASWWLLFVCFLTVGGIVLLQLKSLIKFETEGWTILVPIDMENINQEMTFSEKLKITLKDESIIDVDRELLTNGYYRIKFDKNGNAMVDGIVGSKPQINRSNHLYLPCKYEERQCILLEITPVLSQKHLMNDALFLGIKTNGNGSYYIEGLFDANGNIIN